MIPAEAVEAAAKVYQDLLTKGGYPSWCALDPRGRELKIDTMRAALEAAAPYMID